MVLVVVGSRGVPRPSVFIVSTLLARVMLRLWEERFEGARPRRGRRRRRGRVGEVEDAGAGGGAGSEWVRWWWARREEMAGPRLEESNEEGRGGFGGEMAFVGEMEGFGGEELGVISLRGTEGDDVLWGPEESFSVLLEIGRGGSSSSRYSSA